MLKDIVNIIKDISLRHKLVKTFRYQSEILNNAQNNYGTYQVYLDDLTRSRLNITTNIFVVTFTMHILSQPNKDKDSIIDIQSTAYDMGVQILGYLDNHPDYQGIMRVYDYDILTVSHYTDDDSAGVRMTIELEVPSPLNLCENDDYFNELPYEEEPDKDITIDDKEVGELNVKPIKLPKSPKRC